MLERHSPVLTTLGRLILPPEGHQQQKQQHLPDIYYMYYM